MSTLQTQPAPQATATPAPAAPTQANFSRPTTANANENARDAINPMPAVDAPPAVPAKSQSRPTIVEPSQTVTPSPEEPQTYNDKLNTADRYWKFKLALIAVLLITGLIGIGCFGWIITSSPGNSYSYYGYDSYWSLWPSFITWSISIIWCITCILCFLVRKHAVHPGVRVAMDLLLWLGFIVTAMFAVIALTELMDWGRYGDIGYGYSSSSSGGDYVLADNNTWVWEQDSSYINIARDCNSTQTSSYYDSAPTFKDCAEQDAFINMLWHEKTHRVNIELTGVVCQFFGLVFHFALFVWACVDTHRHNRTKVSKDAEKLAAGIVQTMIQNGAIVPPPGQAYMRPEIGQGMYYQLPPQQGYGQPQPQQHPMASMHPAYRMPMHQNQVMPSGHHPAQGIMAPAAGPSNEKGQPRYA